MGVVYENSPLLDRKVMSRPASLDSCQLLGSFSVKLSPFLMLFALCPRASYLVSASDVLSIYNLQELGSVLGLEV